MFRDRNPSNLLPFLVNTIMRPSDTTSVVQCEAVEHFHVGEELQWAPLHARAWVLQERILARRVLHFTRNELMWECAETDASESYPLGFPGHISRRLKKTSGFDAHKSGSYGLRDSLYETWENICATYANASLTFADDRMIAFSGIAKRFQDLLGDRYVLGMWRSRILNDLLWTVVSRHDVASLHGTKYSPPSFSWLSQDEAFIAHHSNLTMSRNKNELATVIDFDAKFLTDDPTGIVVSAVLSIAGPLRRLRLKARSSAADLEDYCRYQAYFFDELVDLDTWLDSEAKILTPNGLRDDLYILLLLDCGENDEVELYGLILEEAQEKAGHYRRLGVARLTNDGDVSGKLLEFQIDQRSYPYLAYDTEAERHTIGLV